KLGDRRQLLLDRAVLIEQVEAGGVLEFGQRTALDPAGVEQLIELAQRGLGVGALQIVVGAEEALAAGLALAAGDRAERVPTPRDGGEEPLLALHVGGDRTED